MFVFLDKCTWIDCIILPVLWREYLSWAVIVLANCTKILAMTTRDVSQLNFSQNNQKSLYHADYQKVSWNRAF